MSSSAPCPVEGQPMFPPPTCNSGMWLASGVNYPADTKLLMTNTSREPEEPMQQKVRIVLPREAQWITLSRMPPAPGRATLGAVTTFALRPPLRGIARRSHWPRGAAPARDRRRS